MTREFKDSGIEWIGSIPKDWNMRPLSIYFAENSKQNSDFLNDNALQFKYGEIIQKPNNGKELSKKDRELLEKYTVVEPNDIVVNGLNLNYDLKSLRIAKVRENGIITSAYIVLRPRNNANASYYNYYLKSLDFQKIFHGMGVGIRLTLSYNELRSMQLPVPSEEEQKRIVNFLDTKCAEIDALVELQEQMIAKLTDYKQSVITEAVTKGLVPDVVLVPSGIDWIGDVPKGWNTYALKRTMKMYAGATPKSDDESFWDGDISWITPADYKTEDLFVSTGKRNISEKGMKSCATTMLPEGSIIFSKRAPIGSVVINNHPLCTNQGCIGCIIESKRAYNKYLYFTLSIFKEQFELYGSGTTFKEISAFNFANFVVPVPPISVQHDIANYLESKCGEIDSLISIKRQKIEKLKDYKKSVIFEAVTGKIEV